MVKERFKTLGKKSNVCFVKNVEREKMISIYCKNKLNLILGARVHVVECLIFLKLTLLN